MNCFLTPISVYRIRKGEIHAVSYPCIGKGRTTKQAIRRLKIQLKRLSDNRWRDTVAMHGVN